MSTQEAPTCATCKHWDLKGQEYQVKGAVQRSCIRWQFLSEGRYQCRDGWEAREDRGQGSGVRGQE